MKVPAVINPLNWSLWAKFSLVQKAFMISAVFLWYYSALRTSLARVQGFSLMVKRLILLRQKKMTWQKISFLFRLGQKFFVSGHQLQKGPCLGTLDLTLGGHRLPCILPSSTSLDLIPCYIGLFLLLQMLLHRSSLSTHISRFHHCGQTFSPSIW